MAPLFRGGNVDNFQVFETYLRLQANPDNFLIPLWMHLEAGVVQMSVRLFY